MTRAARQLERRDSASRGLVDSYGGERRVLWLCLALLFASGAVTLVYELLWMRRFTVVFGASAPAIATTVAAVFAGFALGSAYFGARARAWQRPLRALGWIEIAAAGCALLVPLFLSAYGRFAPLLHERLAGAPLLLTSARAALVLLAVLPVCALLGGTIPAATAVLERHAARAGERAGGLYAANTAGAVAGSLALPFLLLALLGMPFAYAFAALGSLTAGAVALACDRRMGAGIAPARSDPRPQAARPAARLLGLAFASGLLALGLEILWVRMLAQVHHDSLHAFGVVLALFLAALASGAAVTSVLVRRGADPWRLLELGFGAAGLLTLGAPILFSRVTAGLRYVEAEGAGGHLVELARLGGLSFFLPTLCAGMVLPALFAVAARTGGHASAPVGKLLAANGAGAIAGPLIAVFALLPLAGMWGLAVILGAGFAGAALFARFARGGGGLVPLGVAGLLAGAPLAWHSLSLPRAHWEAAQGEELAWLREGSHGIVSVVRDPEGIRMKLDNWYTLGGSRSRAEDRQLGHLPLFLHGAPRRAAFLGLGTGITASAALLHPVEEIVVFELVPEVADAAQAFFGPHNLHLLEDARVRLVLDDARSHLRASAGTFDVIVGDLVVPWRRGEASLHTRGHFAGVRRALAPGGLFCQWLPLFQMTAEELRIVAATFLDVFPSATLWRGDFIAAYPTLALVAGVDPWHIDPAAADRRVAKLSSTLAAEHRYLAHPAGLWLHFIGELGAGADWLSGAPINTDARPWLELSSARTHGSGRAREGALLVGTSLARQLDELSASGALGRPAELDAPHLGWSALGAELFRAAALADAGHEAQAQRRAFGVLSRLPLEIQERILAPDVDAGRTSEGPHGRESPY